MNAGGVGAMPATRQCVKIATTSSAEMLTLEPTSALTIAMSVQTRSHKAAFPFSVAFVRPL